MDQSPAPPVPPARRTAATVFIFITVVLDVLALGIIVPVLPKLVQGLLHGDTAQGAKMYGVFGTVWAAMQFLCSPVLGSLSDRFGRRPVILLSNFGLGLDYVLMALAPTLAWLFAGRVISGITAASFPTAGAYIADVTPPEKRAASFGLLGAAFGLGFILGPALGGLLGQYGERLPFWAAAAFSLANACYGLFVLPESLPPERRAPFSWRKANPVASLELLRSHPELFGLSATVFLYYLAHEVFPAVWVLYTGYRFGWSTGATGGALAAAGLCSALVQATLTRRVVGWLGERGTLLLGTTCGLAGFALYGLADRSWLFCLAIPLGSLWGLASPATQGMMSRRVGASEQGRLQGAMSSMRGIAGMMGPGIYTLTFAAFIAGGGATRRGWHVPGAPFLLGSALLVVAWVLGWVVTKGQDAGVGVGREGIAGAVPAAEGTPGFTSEVG